MTNRAGRRRRQRRHKLRTWSNKVATRLRDSTAELRHRLRMPSKVEELAAIARDWCEALTTPAEARVLCEGF